MSDFLVYQDEKLILCYSGVSDTRAKRIERAVAKRYQNVRNIFMRHGNWWLNADPDDFGLRV